MGNGLGTGPAGRRQVVIIGGGLGGLAAALRLAAKGHPVTVCEQGERCGGKMNLLLKDGFRFDTGPSLITMPWVFADLFAAAGSTLEDHLDLIPVSPLSDYIYPDGVHFTYSSSMPEWFGVLRQLESGGVDGFLRFLKLGAQLFEVSKETFLKRRPLDWPKSADLGVLRHMPWRYGWGNYHKTVAVHFKSPHLQQLYDRYPTYVGSSPYESPATLAVIPYIEFTFGGWYVRGGLYRIVESIVELAESFGVRFQLNARVERIELSGDRVVAVHLADRTRLPADLIVMNGDASHTSALLHNERKESASDNVLLEKDRSMSGFVMLLGMKRSMPELRHHAIYFSSSYQDEFRQLFQERRFPEDPTVYVNAPSRSDRSMTTGEGETLFLMANAPANDEDQWDETQIRAARKRIFSRLEGSGFRLNQDEILVEDVWTPKRFSERYSTPGGAIYGANSHGWKNAFLRPGNKDRRIRGLYYVGGSCHPGGGTPMVLLSAEITCALIERYEDR
jgi:phytoene desaturase